MSSAVIIILREVLEAMLLICTLTASSWAMNLRLRWLPMALLLGAAGAFTYAEFLSEISMSFSGFGQEIVNALLLIMISLLLAGHNYFAVKRMINGMKSSHQIAVLIFMGGAVAMAITREGSEIYLYVYSYGYLAGQTTPVLTGAAIGTGIGFSIGTFIYYGLKILTRRHCLQLCSAMALIIAAGMMSQAVLYFAQADILPTQEALWDSTGLIAESSIMGELLHAAIGYEASPTLLQMSLYVASVLITITAMMSAYRWGGREQPAQ